MSANGGSGKLDRLDTATPPMVVDVSANIQENTRVVLNLGQEVHVTTRDKVELAVTKILPKYRSKADLAQAVSLFIALLLALLASDFKDKFGLTGDTWTAIFVLATIGSAVWLLVEIVRYIRGASTEDVVRVVLEAGDEPDLRS